MIFQEKEKHEGTFSMIKVICCIQGQFKAWEEKFLRSAQTNISHRTLLPFKFFLKKKQSKYKLHEDKIIKYQKLQASFSMLTQIPIKIS